MKNWEGGTKNYPIYWVQIVLVSELDSINKMANELHIDLKEPISKSLLLKSPTSGISSDLQFYRKFIIGENVVIKTRKKFVIDYLKKENNSILIEKISNDF